eukprot:jgi/Mesen1/7944/ME000422S07097
MGRVISSLGACAFLLLFAAASVQAAGDNNAFLVVYKKVTSKKVKDGEEIKVAYSIYNAGSSTAYDVSLSDNTWPTDMFSIEGNDTASWSKLEAGNSLEHSLQLKPSVKALYQTPPAVVTYRVAAKSNLQTSVSTPVPELDLLSDKPQESPLVGVFAVKYGPFAACLAIVASFVVIVLAPQSKKKYLKKRR